VARWCARLGIAPTVVTFVSLALGVAAAVCFATGQQGWIDVGAVSLLLAFVLDCVDGQIARYTRRFSRFGGWLDAFGDRAKEYGAYAGLAAGWSSPHAWPLATAALALQTCRHIADFAYAESRTAVATAPTGVGATLDGSSRLLWLRKVIVLPIGERFLLIAVTAIIGGPALTFPVLLIWGGLAAAYMITGRVLRSIQTGRRSTAARVAAAGPLRDDGPLAGTASRLASRGGDGRPGILPVMRVLGPLAWLAVPILRAGEYAVVVLAGRAAGVSWPWVYGAVAALAAHHYDLVYRLRQGRQVPRWRTSITLGWDGRLLLVLVCALAGGLAVLVPAIAIGVGAIVLAESSLSWIGSSDAADSAEVAA
jgi:phosphatidylglycerophosphate synthase